MDNKTDLRIRAKSIRKTLDINSKSSCAVAKIRNCDVYKSSKHVLIFYPMKYEINLLDLLKDDKIFYLPKVNGDKLFVCRFNMGDNLVKSSFKVYEPCSAPSEPEVLDLMFVPALMADKENYRLGYGGGYYDRFIALYPAVKTITPIYTELYVDKLPHETFDKKVDLVIKC